jgi:hypothetical protein
MKESPKTMGNVIIDGFKIARPVSGLIGRFANANGKIIVCGDEEISHRTVLSNF